MGRLIFSATVSLDGYAADAAGDLDWGAPSAEVFAVHLERVGEVSTEVLGRRTAVGMHYWETYPDTDAQPADEREFGRRWRDLDKVVVSTTLTDDDLPSDRARLVRELPLDELRRIVDAAPGLVEIFGPTTAAPAIRAGLVEEYRLFVKPVLLGGGLRALPDGVRLDLERVEHRAFDDGTTYLRCAAR